MVKALFLSLILLAAASGCASAPPALPTEAPRPASTALPGLPPTATRLPPTRPATLTPFPSPTATPSALPAVPQSDTVFQGPGAVVCPILLYHRIAVPEHASEYYVTPEEFQAQMQALKEWGYTSIRPSDLIQAITHGAALPARPVIISFDDGDESVYTTAYPVMQALGFAGVNYLVSNYINKPGYMTTAQLQELAAAGWETGSHSVSHADLTQTSDVEFEVVHSRKALETLLGVPVVTFAYPYGQANERTIRTVSRHYRAAMGLGSSTTQRPDNRYYLWRRPVKLGWDLSTFGAFLPWNTPPSPAQP